MQLQLVVPAASNFSLSSPRHHLYINISNRFHFLVSTTCARVSTGSTGGSSAPVPHVGLAMGPLNSFVKTSQSISQVRDIWVCSRKKWIVLSIRHSKSMFSNKRLDGTWKRAAERTRRLPNCLLILSLCSQLEVLELLTHVQYQICLG